ncbi:Chromatin structure-remodeling complex subunit SFH1 [Candida viswanathii]|uniref:Chromatin structure-remodeling complex subunit SFH1 n=1 Tax=Candida viswanathii TaxID=5486 RepID=A0A367XSE2_9ASCO|nr:Chromatin structure-remodeling complex subunit SFH1 [Candida viswanathii]
MNDSENSLLFNIAPTGRQAKRHVQQINYSEDFVDDFDTEDSPSSAFGNRNLSENRTQVELQKYSLAKNTPSIKNLASELLLPELVENPVVLIPIKVALENLNSNQKLVDTFMWNLNESVVTPLEFAEIVCTDLELPTSMAAQIADSINQQVEEYSYASNLILPTEDPYNVTVELTVNLNKHLYQDRFEWDMNQTDVTPEMFAQIVIIKVKKKVIDGNFDNEIYNLHLVKGIVFELGIRIFSETSIQNGNDRWEPLVETLTSSEIERRENERVRSLRRLKRENLRGGYDDYNKRRHTGRRRFDELEGSWS